MRGKFTVSPSSNGSGYDLDWEEGEPNSDNWQWVSVAKFPFGARDLDYQLAAESFLRHHEEAERLTLLIGKYLEGK